jgi:hypothetical protein
MHLLATSRPAPKHVKQLTVFVLFMRLVAVAAVGITASSLYRRRPQLRQQVSVRTVSI